MGITRTMAAAVAVGAALSSSLWAQQEGKDTLEHRLAARLAEMECPGAVVGVFPDEGTPRRFALGVADVDSKQPITLDMHFRVGSVMKPFLGTTVLRLCQQGKLSLDDPVSKYVEGVPGGDKITLKMLGANTSGLFNTIENKAFQKAVMAEPTKQWTPSEIFEFTFDHEPYAAPGEAWRYSNTNAVLLALCVEKVTGLSYSEAIQQQVCKPLALAHTAVPQGPKLPPPSPSAYRNGYPDKVIGYGDVFYNVSNYSAAWTGAAGNLYSTLDDLGRAARPLATGELLGEQQRKELFDWIDTGYEEVEYGFCLYRRDQGVGHPGDVPGFNAFMAYYPELKVSIVVMTNLSNNNDDTMPAPELAEVALEGLRSANE